MSRTFTVDLLTLAEPFQAWCRARNKTRSQSIRALVAAALDPEQGGTFSLVPDAPQRALNATNARANEPGRERRFTLRLGDDNLKCLRKQSAAAGMPASRYLAALISAVESRGASIASQEAVVALMQSTQQLAWIGRLLDDATRRSTGSPGNPVNLEGGELREALGLLRKHLANAARALAEVENTRCRREGALRQLRHPQEKTK